MLQYNMNYGPMASRMNNIEERMDTLLALMHSGMPWVPVVVDQSLMHISQERIEMQKYMIEERNIAFKEIKSQRLRFKKQAQAAA